MTTMLFFTSDTHFGDSRVLRIDRRPFTTIKAHDEALIAFWNETVRPQDEIWHLGDFTRGGPDGYADYLLSALNGTKHLIIGNNDDEKTISASGWVSAQHYAELTIEGRQLILCHYPFRTWNNIGRKSINLHGHSHGKLKPVTRQFDVGVDARNYRPTTLEALLSSRLRGRKAAE